MFCRRLRWKRSSEYLTNNGKRNARKLWKPVHKVLALSKCIKRRLLALRKIRQFRNPKCINWKVWQVGLRFLDICLYYTDWGNGFLNLYVAARCLYCFITSVQPSMRKRMDAHTWEPVTYVWDVDRRLYCRPLRRLVSACQLLLT